MQHKIPVMLVHPDGDYCQRITRILEDFQCHVHIKAHDEKPADEITAADCRILIIHEDLIFPHGPHRIAIHSTEQGAEHVSVILISDKVDIRKAVGAMQNGAYDYFTKNSDDLLLRESLAGALKNLNPDKSNDMKRSHPRGHRSIVSISNKMNQVLNVAKRVAASNATVLIQGESGTGKELFARYIHQHSGRQKKPFVATNCAALPDNLAESELFGYEKGAFTGANQYRMGKFEQANGGTLLLDEISEMPMALQVKLLRVLQEKEVDPIGGRKSIPVDTRVIATCNKDLATMVRKGRFREDLYYRLRVIPLCIPPLRERKEDIPLLVEHFVSKLSDSRPNEEIRISSDTLEQLSNCTWSGNVRELENTIERAMLICEGSVIGPEHLLLDDDGETMDKSDNPTLVGMTVKEMEKKLIGQTLQKLNDNRTHAAKMLGISIRTLRNKLREYENAGGSAIAN